MEKQGITGAAAEEIIRSITSFALYGFPESHAASFALLVYASAYLKAHYPAAFFTSMLNNQPMGFYHPATLVKDAQRHGVRFAPIDVQISDWECRVEPDGRVRLGLMYVNGLRAEIGRLIGTRGSGLPPLRSPLRRASGARGGGGTSSTSRVEFGKPVANRCPKCGNDDQSMLEDTQGGGRFCNICAHEWSEQRSNVAAPTAVGVLDSEPRVPLARRSAQREGGSPEPRSDGRFTSIEDLIRRTGVRRDELATLAEIGALNAFGHDRRSALWQIERAARPAGELFQGHDVDDSIVGSTARGDTHRSPLSAMTPSQRLMSDYSGTSLTIGPHPLAFRRMELAMRGVLRAVDLPRGRNGRRVRVAGAVITRQRPGTAKGFVFLTLEDETGIANIIVRPDLFGEDRATIVNAPYLMVEGILQIQEGVTSVKAERLISLAGDGPEPQSHDFR
jgi:error-prone DNA polymerase